MKYDNEVCPVCSKEFNTGDDIVVCPDCGTPHHRECWNNNKECANASLHNEGFKWEPKNRPNEEHEKSKKLGIICPVCGTNCPPDFNFCPVCSTPLHSSKKQGNGEKPSMNTFSDGIPAFQMQNSMNFYDMPFPPETDIDGITAAEASVYVQTNSRKYISRFIKNKTVSWNWAAFIFSPFWFFYRKMYKVGFFALAIFIAVWLVSAGPVQQASDNFELQYSNIIESYDNSNLTQEEINELNSQAGEIFLEFSKAMMPFVLINLVIKIGCGLAANYFYKKKTVSDVKMLKKAAKEQEAFNFLALKKGGVSAFSAIGSIVGYQILVMMLSELPLLF